jgi:hypothetical protein
MNDHKKIVDAYDKIKATIKTSITEDHMNVVNNMINNLMVLCLNEQLPYDYYMLYIRNLKMEVKERLKQLGKVN